ncbi:MAG: bifunctional sulfate adenylyltransferase/adenylylsulfate kinase [Chloroflexi bacterium]|nr:bifunctional sulfate adenylyltransferase/adenylylsulfate kinase [Chloroflexota bacterium]
MSTLITPYGGELVNLSVAPDEVADAKSYAGQLPSIQLTERQKYDLELLSVGAFSPLKTFMGKEDYQSVLDTMCLKNGLLFPIPITLSVDPSNDIQIGQEIALRDRKNNILAILKIKEVYNWDLEEAAEKVYGKMDLRHPLVSEMHRWGKVNISGPLQVIQSSPTFDFIELRRTPAQTRELLEAFGHVNVVAFQTRNPLHRVHEELTKRAIEELDGTLLLHPVVGMTRPGDVDHFTRVRTYKALAENYYDPDRIVLSLLPLAMRMAGPREAVWHSIIRRNYGANHLIIGRDHAGPGNDSEGNPFYGPYDAQELVEKYYDEIGVKVVPFRMMVYMTEEERYEEVSKVPDGTPTASISGTQVREDYLKAGRSLPEWFTRPEVAEILAERYPPRFKQGCCIWFTGLSGSGKSTTADVLTTKLAEYGRRVTLLDGDVVRTHLSKGLTFSPEDRDINIRRIGFVASEIVHHGGVAIAAAISPYRATRNDVRNMVGQDNFVEIYVATPIEVCEERDTKGFYAKARRGEISDFTGIDSPYEEPINPELTLYTIDRTPEENAQIIIDYLLKEGYLLPNGTPVNGNGHR